MELFKYKDCRGLVRRVSHPSRKIEIAARGPRPPRPCVIVVARDKEITTSEKGKEDEDGARNLGRRSGDCKGEEEGRANDAARG